MSQLGVVTLSILLVLRHPAAGQESASLPVRYNATTLQGDGGVCPPADERGEVRADITQDIRKILNPYNTTCGCGGVGWTRIAYLNMTDPTHQCRSAWRNITRNPTTGAPRSCGRINVSGCDSTHFSVGGRQYRQVCGRIIAYQFGSPDAFGDCSQESNNGIDDTYVDGVSVTHGDPRKHIWTFVGAVDEMHKKCYNICPCTNSPTTEFFIPDFVGKDYFCETGIATGESLMESRFHPNDPLWDGIGCGSNSTCCTFNNPPWFCKQLPQPTTDDLEVRIYGNQHNIFDEDTPIELIEIYVK